MIASLPMYDWPEVQPAYDRLWSGVAARLTDHGVAAPMTLLREGDLWDHWQAPDLLLSQTCGLPFRARLRGKVRLVGTPDYGLEGCPSGHYASKIVVRVDDEKTTPKDWVNKRLVYNENSSQSGWASILNYSARLGTGFASHIASGAHRVSAHMVAEGKADIAAIDAQSWRLLVAHDPCVAALKVIDQTDPTPGTPFITALDTSDQTTDALFQALIGAVAEMPDDDRHAIHLKSVVRIPESAYYAVPTPAH